MTRRLVLSRSFVAACMVLALGLALTAGSLAMVAGMPSALQTDDSASPAAATPEDGDTQAGLEALVEPALDLPDSIDITYLGAGAAGPVPHGSVALTMERITVEPGAPLSLGAPGETSINVIETGTVLVEHDGTPRILAEGANFSLGLGKLVEVSTAESTAATILRLAVSTGQATPATPAGTPVPVTAQSLAGGDASYEGSGEDVLYLVRLDLDAGADSGIQALSGPAAVVAEQGQALVAVAGEAAINLASGAGAILPALTPVQVQSTGGATLLVGGVLAIDEPLATGPRQTPAASPTPGPDLAATAQATADALGSQLMTAEAELALAETAVAEAEETVAARETAIAGLEEDVASAEARRSRRPANSTNCKPQWPTRKRRPARRRNQYRPRKPSWPWLRRISDSSQPEKPRRPPPP
jgi:hypothetical protein